MTKAKTISDFTPQKMNANLHTKRGLEALEASMNEVGYTAPMVAAADGELIIGSARLETATEVYGVNSEPIIVESDGTKPIIVVRTDIPNADSKIAKRIGLLDNRVQQMDLNFDPSVLAQLEAETPGLLAGLWSNKELDELMKSIADNGVGTTDVEPQTDKAEELQQKWGVESGQTWKLAEHTLFVGSAEKAKINCKIAIYDPPFDWSWQQQDNCLSWVRWETSVLMGLHYCMPLTQRHDFCHWWVWDSGMARFGGQGYKPMSGCAIVLVFGEKRNWYELQGLSALDRAEIKHYDWPVQVVKIQDSLQDRGYLSHQKPYPLYDYIVSLYSKAGEVVGDPFAGSGGFLIACHNLKRQYHGSEISCENAAVILQRFQDTFGITPQLC